MDILIMRTFLPTNNVPSSNYMTHILCVHVCMRAYFVCVCFVCMCVHACMHLCIQPSKQGVTKDNCLSHLDSRSISKPNHWQPQLKMVRHFTRKTLLTT